MRHPELFKSVAEHLVGSGNKVGRGLEEFSPQGLGEFCLLLLASVATGTFSLAYSFYVPSYSKVTRPGHLPNNPSWRKTSFVGTMVKPPRRIPQVGLRSTPPASLTLERSCCEICFAVSRKRISKITVSLYSRCGLCYCHFNSSHHPSLPFSCVGCDYSRTFQT